MEFDGNIGQGSYQFDSLVLFHDMQNGRRDIDEYKKSFNSRNNIVLAIGATAPPEATRMVMEFLMTALYSFGFSISGTNPSCPNMPLLLLRGIIEDFPVTVFVIGGPESWPISSCNTDDVVSSDSTESESVEEGFTFGLFSLNSF